MWLPYYYDPRIEDMTPIDKSRRDSFLASLDASEEHWKYVGEMLARIEPELSRKDSPFYDAISDNSNTYPSIQAEDWAYVERWRGWPQAQRDFDNMVIARFYNMLSIGMLLRLVRGELEAATAAGNQEWRLEKAEIELDEAVVRGCSELEKALSYKVTTGPGPHTTGQRNASGEASARQLISLRLRHGEEEAFGVRGGSRARAGGAVAVGSYILKKNTGSSAFAPAYLDHRIQLARAGPR